jgi:glycopeptide antibiotics resistance protein
VIAIATLSNLAFHAPGAEEFQRRLAAAVSPSIAARDVVDGLRNLLLFAGWGLAWCLTADDRRLLRAVVMATLTGMLISAGVESAQLFSVRRQASILDLLTNTGGAFLGGMGAVVLLHAARATRAARSFVGMPMFVFAAAYGTAAMLEIVLPGLRQEVLPGAWGGPLARFRISSAQIGWGSSGFGPSLLQAFLLLPAGAFAVAALVESGRSYPRALWITSGAGVLLVSILEIARGFTGQPIEIGLMVAHGAGVLGGAWLAARWLPVLTRRVRGRARPRLLAAAYVSVLPLWAWRPFVPHFRLDELRESFARGHIIPLKALAMKVDMFSASDVTISFMLSLPLGALLAVWPLRRRGWLAHMLPGVWVVALVEAGQLLVQGRFFDTTDIIIGASGILAGWGLMRRSGFRPYGEVLDRPSGSRPGSAP